MKHKNVIIFWAFLSAIIVFTTPVIAKINHNNISIKTELINNTSKDGLLYDEKDVTQLLFQTIIGFCNNGDYLNLLKKNGFNFEFENNDLKDICKKLLLKNPRTILSLFRFKPTVSEDYLRFLYNQGVEISKVLDEYEIKSLIKSLKLYDQDFNQEIKNIVISNTELENNIDILNEINCDYVIFHNFNESPKLSYRPPIICAILLFINIAVSIYAFIISGIISIITQEHYRPPIAFAIHLITSDLRFQLNC
jgi:hypothetical protein